jgi:hypothetical protein
VEALKNHKDTKAQRVLLRSLILLLAASMPAAAQDEGKLPPPARYGMQRLQEAHKGVASSFVYGGLCGSTEAKERLAGVPLPSSPESFVIRVSRGRKQQLLMCGTDARGLMYAALEAAERVSWAANQRRPFEFVRDTTQRPFIRERTISMYTMHRGYFESRLFDEKYWERYFDLLASSRINRFLVIFGYENGGFMAPLYPYFFDVPEFPSVKLAGLSGEQQRRNTAAFRRMIGIAHERGIDVAVGIWDHIYRGGVQGGGIAGASELAGKTVPGLVTGVTSGNLAPYTKAALKKFLELFPEVDGVQFRMHDESGLKPSEMEGFWHEVFGIIKRARPDLPVEIRAKGLPDSIIRDAVGQGLRFRVNTKFWMEQMGLPFHPSHVNAQNQHDRRHGYADLLRYPQIYKVNWQLWTGGTTRLLLWGDPEYVRRFANSARLYDGDSYEVNEMLATRMLGEPHDAAPRDILNAKYRYYDYDFERYWYFYKLWGRMGYDPTMPDYAWTRDFERRFGEAGKPLMEALTLASRVLPRIVAASYPYNFFPTTRGWPEMMRLGDLPKFAAEHVTDTEQFMNAKDRARQIVERRATGKRTPEETSYWFAETSRKILEHIALAEKAAAKNNEFISTVADLKILAGLAEYHSHRLAAAVQYSLFEELHDSAMLDEAISLERLAVAAWKRMVDAAGDIYSEDLAFGVHRVGFPRHWKEELANLYAGLTRLEQQRAAVGVGAYGVTHLRRQSNELQDRVPPKVQVSPPQSATPGQPLQITAHATDPSGVRHVRLYYRHVTQFEDYEILDMAPTAGGVYSARIPGNFIVPQWDLMYFIEAIDTAGNGRRYPDLELEAPYVIVRVR